MRLYIYMMSTCTYINGYLYFRCLYEYIYTWYRIYIRLDVSTKKPMLGTFVAHAGLDVGQDLIEIFTANCFRRESSMIHQDMNTWWGGDHFPKTLVGVGNHFNRNVVYVFPTINHIHLVSQMPLAHKSRAVPRYTRCIKSHDRVWKWNPGIFAHGDGDELSSRW